MVKVFGTLLWPCERLRRSWSRHHRGRRRFHRFGILVLVDGQLPVRPRAPVSRPVTHPKWKKCWCSRY